MKRKINYALLDALHEAGLSQQQLSLKAGLSRGYVNSVVHGSRVLTVPAARKIGEFIPNFDFNKLMMESGTRIWFEPQLNPACQMIVDLMKLEGLNQRRLAMKVGIACSTINEILKGKRKLIPIQANKIQKVYPEFDAKKAINRQSRIYGSGLKHKKYEEQWKLQQLQNS